MGQSARTTTGLHQGGADFEEVHGDNLATKERREHQDVGKKSELIFRPFFVLFVFSCG